MLADIIRPSSTAILCMEMQRGVVGDLSNLNTLRRIVEGAGMPGHLSELVNAGRIAGVGIAYCNFVRRRDDELNAYNCRILARLRRYEGHLVEGSASAELIPELSVEPGDVVSERSHGMSPFTGTGLDGRLRDKGVKTIIATGVSLNVGVVGMTIEAVGLGYDVVIPSDCVSGFPQDYADAVLANCLGAMATIVESPEIIAGWRQSMESD